MSSVGNVGDDLDAVLGVDLVGELVHAPEAVRDVLAAAFEGGHHAGAGDVIGRGGVAFSSLAKAGTCDVSVPMMPTRRSAAAAQSAEGE